MTDQAPVSDQDLFVSDPLAYAEAFKARHGIYPMAGAEDEAEEQDKPDASADAEQAEESEDSEPTIPEDPEQLRKSYQELRGEYTRRTQEWSEKERQAEQHSRFVGALLDPETQADALRAIGLEIEDLEDLEGEPDPDERVARLEQAFVAQQEQAQMADFQQREDEFVANRLLDIEEREDRELTDQEADIVYRMATSPALRKQNGEPDVAAAFQALNGAWSERQKTWTDSKRAPRAPGQGRSASKSVDLSNPEERRKLMEQVADDAFSREE